MKLKDLKLAVYKLAEVTTTTQLKAQHEALRSLDMRYKASWEKALDYLQSGHLQPEEISALERDDVSAEETQQLENSSNFEDWVKNPSDAYKSLFAEADATIGAFAQKLSKTKKLTKTALAMVESLDEFAEASLAEAKKLAEAVSPALKRTVEDTD